MTYGACVGISQLQSALDGKLFDRRLVPFAKMVQLLRVSLIALLFICHEAHGIEGGVDASVGEFKFIVSVEHNGLFGWSHVCGGTVVNENFVLTSASCIDGIREKNIRVFAGEHRINSDEGFEQERYALELIVHEFYDSTTNTNDVGLIRLDAPLDLTTNTVLPVDLATSEDVLAPGTYGTIIGWGSGGTFSRDLQKADLPVISDADCRLFYDFTQIGDSMVCAHEVGGGVGPCEGDSGGPYMSAGTQYGIISWAEGCGDAQHPSVYTELPYFREWIDTHAV